MDTMHLFIEIWRRATSYKITLVSLCFIHMIYIACLGYSRIFSHKVSHTSLASFVSMMLETFFIHVEVLRLNYDGGVVASSFGLPKYLDKAPFIVDETNLRQPRLIGWRTFRKDFSQIVSPRGINLFSITSSNYERSKTKRASPKIWKNTFYWVCYLKMNKKNTLSIPRGKKQAIDGPQHSECKIHDPSNFEPGVYIN